MARKVNNRLPMLITGLGLGVAVGVAGTVAATVFSAAGYSAPTVAGEQLPESTLLMSTTSDLLVQNNRTRIVDKLLDNRPIALLRTEDAASPVVDSLKELIDAAGGSVAADITLNSGLFDRKNDKSVFTAVKRSLPDSVPLPKNPAPGERVATALGAALLLDPNTAEPLVKEADRAAILTGLASKKVISYTPGTILPAQAVVIVTGDMAPGDAPSRLATIATTLRTMSNGVVVGSPSTEAPDDGVIGILRSQPESPVSTVDTVSYSAGQVVTIVALAQQLEGAHGAYGVAGNAEAEMPSISRSLNS